MRILFVEVALLLFLFLFSFSFFFGELEADSGGNVSVTGNLTIGKSAPNIRSIDIEGGTVTLTPNSTTTVNCSVVIEDYDGDDQITLVTARFFDEGNSSYSDADDNNTHYTNSSCDIDSSYGDSYQVLSNCLFEVEYYANPLTWTCSVNVTDQDDFEDFQSNTTEIEALLAVGLPSLVDYGEVNASVVSDEQAVNVSNAGNVPLNLSLSGYGVLEGDGHAMSCTVGNVQNISVVYEKYNLTSSNTEVLSLSQFEGNYTNLTSSPVVRDFGLNYRQNDTGRGFDDWNTTYWRIYVPTGVGGTCNGSVVFGATQAAEV